MVHGQKWHPLITTVDNVNSTQAKNMHNPANTVCSKMLDAYHLEANLEDESSPPSGQNSQLEILQPSNLELRSADVATLHMVVPASSQHTELFA